MKLNLLVLLLFKLPVCVLAQSEKCSFSDSIMAHTDSSITRVKKGGMENWGVLYCNTMEINSYKDQWRAVGNYNCKVNFWYTDAPEFAEYEEKTKESVLVKTTIETETSAYTYYYDFYYNNGALIAAKSKSNVLVPFNSVYYISDGKLIKYLTEGKTSTNDKAEEYPEIINISKEFAALFLNMFIKSTH